MPARPSLTPRTRAGTTALAAGVLGAALLAGCSDSADEPTRATPPPRPAATTPPPASESSTSTPPDSEDAPEPGPVTVLSTLASDLEVPWGMDTTAAGDVLVTERDSGRILRLTRSDDGEPAADGSAWRIKQVGRIDSGTGVEGGVLGIASRPVSADKELGPLEVFVHVTTARDNRILRATTSDSGSGDLSGWEPVLTGIPRSDFHDGGRIAFGPDGHLWISTGDAGNPDLAQDRDSLAGKILRVTAEGDSAPGNPFPDSPVWSYGHRNVQGLAWDDDDQLWATEFGQSTSDELNRVVKGGNHGWPLAEGEDGPRRAPDGTELVEPVRTWPTDDASPSGLAFAAGRLWMAGLRGERLWEIPVTDGEAGKPRAWLKGEHGRLRSVMPGPDGTLWVATSNRDGRGDPTQDDDRILQVQVSRQ